MAITEREWWSNREPGEEQHEKLFITRRLAFYVVAAWVAITVNFAIPRVMPGNAVNAMLAKFPQLDANSLKALEAEFGTHAHGSLLSQYFTYLGNLAHGDLGLSVNQYPAKVTTIIGQTLPWTVILVGTATIIAFVLGTLLGVLSAWRRGGWLDRSLPAFTFLQATPYFFLALVVIQLFAVSWGLFPFGQGYDLGQSPGWNWSFISSAIDHSILPALTIVLTSMAGWMLQMRNVMITTIAEDYVLVAQAKGLSPRRVMFSYAGRNAILPNLAGFALSLGFVVAGALVMEIVFSYPGIGLTLYNAVTSDDFPLLQGIFLVISLSVLGACLIADIVYFLADPRTRTRTAY
jgi:peptide/nickel transport system permease protein